VIFCTNSICKKVRSNRAKCITVNRYTHSPNLPLFEPQTYIFRSPKTTTNYIRINNVYHTLKFSIKHDFVVVDFFLSQLVLGDLLSSRIDKIWRKIPKLVNVLVYRYIPFIFPLRNFQYIKRFHTLMLQQVEWGQRNMFCEFRWEMIVSVVDIGEIVDHPC